jgi:diacylglycerol kinase (ATP)
MRAIVILNPVSGASTLAPDQNSAEQNEERIIEALRSQNVEPEVRYTTPEDPGNGLAKQAAEEEDVDVVVAAGGDGTIHAVATGLIGTRGTLGVIPTGTMNNIAHSLHIPEDIDEACKIIANGQTKRMDVGKVNDQVFLEVSGAGLEAALFPAAEEIKSQGLLSSLRGIIGGLDTLFSYRPTRFKVSFDERRSRPYQAVQVSVCNTPYYGARLQFAPGALMDDGLLDVLIYKNFSKLEYLRHAFSISQGRRALLPKVIRRKAKSIRITADTPVEVHADGVAQGITPATVEVVPGALQVRVPEHVASGPNVSDPGARRSRHTERARSSELFKENELTKKEQDTKEKGSLYAR